MRGKGEFKKPLTEKKIFIQQPEMYYVRTSCITD